MSRRNTSGKAEVCHAFGRSPVVGQNKPFMYYVYILRSTINNDLYVGSTQNIENRLHLHNSGRVKSTKGYKPWILLESESYPMRSKAVQRERFLKTGQQKELLRKKYGAVAKW